MIVDDELALWTCCGEDAFLEGRPDVWQQIGDNLKT